MENREYITRRTTEIRDSEAQAKAYNRGNLSPKLIPRDTHYRNFYTKTVHLLMIFRIYPPPVIDYSREYCSEIIFGI